MRLLVTGSGGLLGLNLTLDALRSHEVVGLDRGRLTSVPFQQIQMDLIELGSIDRALKESRPDALVHCAAAADVDYCERNPDAAERINVDVPARIGIACKRAGVRLIHISTDAVFDGRKNGNYSETDSPNPTGVYARTKYEAEAAVMSENPQAIVARVNFYGWSVSGQRSLAEFFVNNLRRGVTIRGFTDVVFCPMLVNDLGELLLEMSAAGLRGLYHAVGPAPMTKFQFGRAIASKFGFDEGLVSPDSVEVAGLTARRSHNLSLSTSKLSTDLGRNLPEFSTGLEKLFTQYAQGYPQRIQRFALAGSSAGLG